MMQNQERPKPHDEIESPFLRAFAQVADREGPSEDLSTDNLAGRLVARFNRMAPLSRSPSGAVKEAPEFHAWRVCRMLTRRFGELRLRGRFDNRGSASAGAAGPQVLRRTPR
jgi:hypothetical protein